MLTGKRKYIWTCLICLYLILAAGSIFLVNKYYGSSSEILPGVEAAGINLGGFSREAALQQLEPVFEEIQAKEIMIKLRVGEKLHSWQVSAVELGLKGAPAATIERALACGKEGSLWKRWRERRFIEKFGAEVNPVWYLDKQKAAAKLSNLVENLHEEPVDATFLVKENDTVQIVPGKTGGRVQIEEAVIRLEDVVAGGELPDVLELVYEKVEPEITMDKIADMNLKGLLAVYQTTFNADNVNRTYNLHIAADAFNNFLLAPGEVFSFNRVVGPRSKESGYKEALIIVDNEFVPGLGGGVCQVSSTLYNAVLLSNLKITERRNHSLPVGYVELGRDATVSFGATDFKFKNNTSGYILLKSKVSGRTLTVKIYGNTDEILKCKVTSQVEKEIEPKVVTKPDPDLYEGKTVVEQQGTYGYIVKVWRLFYDAQGQVIKREMISRDTYKAIDEIIREGKKPISPLVPIPPPVEPTEPQPEPPEEPDNSEDEELREDEPEEESVQLNGNGLPLEEF